MDTKVESGDDATASYTNPRPTYDKPRPKKRVMLPLGTHVHTTSPHRAQDAPRRGHPDRRLEMLSLTASLLAYTLQPTTPHAAVAARHLRVAAPPQAVAAAPPGRESLGRVLRLGERELPQGLVVIEPAERAESSVGELVRFGEAGGTGVLLAERCGLYFAARLDDDEPPAGSGSDGALLLGAQLELGWTPDDGWGGVRDHLGRRIEGAGDGAADVASSLPVFCEPVPQQQRKPIGESVHCGVVALDALTPLGRGQSMALFAPDELPEGVGRSALAQRVVAAQSELGGLRCVLVLTGAPSEQQQAVEALRASGALENTMVLRASSPMDGVIASHSACSIAAAAGGDVLVVIDDLSPQLALWRASCVALRARGVEVRAEEEGSQQRSMYATLTERSARRKEGGSTTLLLLQPAPSVRAAAADRKQSYTLEDFERAGYSQRACARVEMLASKGVELTEEVLTKLGIPSPGSGHPQGGGARSEYQHLEELTSLVDGHIELRESLAAAGRSPPLDPSNSLTRIGVGTAKTLRAAGSTPAMQDVTRALRLELAAASDPAGCEPRQQRRAAAYLAVLQQPSPRPMALSEEVLLLLAASEGLLDEPASRLDADAMGALLQGLAAHAASEAPELLAKIDATGVLLEAAAAELRALLAKHLEAQ